MSSMPLGLYLWKRIQQVGIGSVLGVPGDFNLELLDHIYDVQGLRFIGNANELDAAYAADGYARVKGVPGCFVTTHGVGELSALNGVAGSHAEHVGVIHVVGQPSRLHQAKRTVLHHSISSDAPDHSAFVRMSEPARTAAAQLWNVKTAPDDIDRAIRECIILSLPVYIYVPSDMVNEQVPASLLNTNIDLSYPVDKEAELKAANDVVSKVTKSKRPILFVDALTQRCRSTDEARRLVDLLNFPTYTSSFAKGVIDERYRNFCGTYRGKPSEACIKEAFAKSDLVLVLGHFDCDTNTGVWTRDIRSSHAIYIMPNHVIVRGKRYNDVFMKPFLSMLLEKLDKQDLPKLQIPAHPSAVPASDATSKLLTHSWTWKRLAEYLLPGDVVVADTGTAAYGMIGTRLPSEVSFIHQSFYCSIGYATPAALGCELALKERHLETGAPRGRTVLIQGDGGLQMTMSEIGAMVANGLAPIIFIINNSGYTIERAIHGANRSYNDIPTLDYSKLLQLFRCPNAEHNYHKAITKMDFDAICNRDSIISPTSVQMVELIMDKKDVPVELLALIRMTRGEEYLLEEGFIKGKVGPLKKVEDEDMKGATIALNYEALNGAVTVAHPDQGKPQWAFQKLAGHRRQVDVGFDGL